MRCIGVDLHSNSLTACYLDQNGSEQLRSFDLKELVKFQATLELSDTVAVEATGNTRHFREAIKSLCTTLINKIHALHVAAGITSKKSSFSSRKGLRRGLERNWDKLTRAELEVIVNQIASLNEGIKRLDRELSKYGRQLSGHRNLTKH